MLYVSWHTVFLDSTVLVPPLLSAIIFAFISADSGTIVATNRSRAKNTTGGGSSDVAGVLCRTRGCLRDYFCIADEYRLSPLLNIFSVDHLLRFELTWSSPGRLRVRLALSFSCSPRTAHFHSHTKPKVKISSSSSVCLSVSLPLFLFSAHHSSQDMSIQTYALAPLSLFLVLCD